MSVLDLLKRKSPLEKATKDLKEPFAQPDVRRAAMDKLFELESEEGYAALLQRFTFKASGDIADEDEKRELVDRLVETGMPVVPALRRFISTEKKIQFPVRALSRIVEREECLTFLVATLGAYEPLDHRSIEAKKTLIASIADLGRIEQASCIERYLDDHSDDVQFEAVVALERCADPKSAAALCRVCSSDAHSTRVQKRAAQVLADACWSVKAEYPAFSADLRAEYILGKKGQLVPKGAHSES